MEYQFEEIELCECIGEFEDEYVYDIEMDDPTHTFIANDILVHNSLYISYDPLLHTIEGYDKMNDRERCEFIVKLNQDFLNDHNNKFISEYYANHHAKSVHEFELETVSKSGVYINVKKRYAQILMWKDGKYYDEDKMPLKVKGLEIAKSSTPVYARNILKKLVRFLLESDDKYLTQKLNIKTQQLKQEFMTADIDAICGSLNVHNYTKYVLDDKGEAPKYASKTPSNVKALAYRNWINNRYNLGDEAIYGGKLKWYIVDTKNKNVDIRMAYQARNYPKWGEKYAPVNRSAMFQLFVLDPFNRILSAIGMPIINNDGSIQQTLF